MSRVAFGVDVGDLVELEGAFVLNRQKGAQRSPRLRADFIWGTHKKSPHSINFGLFLEGSGIVKY
jgi:hypothetical protein